MKTRDMRSRIARSFHRNADGYDQHTVVQKRVVAQLMEHVQQQLTQDPVRLLDIGCGTGTLLSALHERYPHAMPYGLDLAFNMCRRSAAKLGSAGLIVNGDAERLPFLSGSFDLIVSASTLQWLPQLDDCFKECGRALREGGIFCAAFFGGRTLWELQESYAEALALCGLNEHAGRLHVFRGTADVMASLAGSGLEQLAVNSEVEIEHHEDVPALLRAIKRVGAATPAGSSGGGLGWRTVLNRMTEIYQSRFMRNNVIPATYEVIYVTGRRTFSGNQEREEIISLARG